jgi:hypothetical protein
MASVASSSRSWSSARAGSFTYSRIPALGGKPARRGSQRVRERFLLTRARHVMLLAKRAGTTEYVRSSQWLSENDSVVAPGCPRCELRRRNSMALSIASAPMHARRASALIRSATFCPRLPRPASRIVQLRQGRRDRRPERGSTSNRPESHLVKDQESSLTSMERSHAATSTGGYGTAVGRRQPHRRPSRRRSNRRVAPSSTCCFARRSTRGVRLLSYS